MSDTPIAHLTGINGVTLRRHIENWIEPARSEGLAAPGLYPAPQPASEVPQDVMEALEPMPETVDRQAYDEDVYPGYVEGNRDWADANSDAIAWLADNHVAIRAALASRASPASVSIRYRHKKSGGTYELTGIGKMQATGWQDADGHSVDMRDVVIYRSVEHGTLWVRPRSEFEDGRFEEITR